MKFMDHEHYNTFLLYFILKLILTLFYLYFYFVSQSDT